MRIASDYLGTDIRLPNDVLDRMFDFYLDLNRKVLGTPNYKHRYVNRNLWVSLSLNPAIPLYYWQAWLTKRPDLLHNESILCNLVRTSRDGGPSEVFMTWIFDRIVSGSVWTSYCTRHDSSQHLITALWSRKMIAFPWSTPCICRWAHWISDHFVASHIFPLADDPAPVLGWTTRQATGWRTECFTNLLTNTALRLSQDTQRQLMSALIRCSERSALPIRWSAFVRNPNLSAQLLMDNVCIMDDEGRSQLLSNASLPLDFLRRVASTVSWRHHIVTNLSVPLDEIVATCPLAAKQGLGKRVDVTWPFVLSAVRRGTLQVKDVASHMVIDLMGKPDAAHHLDELKRITSPNHHAFYGEHLIRNKAVPLSFVLSVQQELSPSRLLQIESLRQLPVGSLFRDEHHGHESAGVTLTSVPASERTQFLQYLAEHSQLTRVRLHAILETANVRAAVRGDDECLSALCENANLFANEVRHLISVSLLAL